MRGPAQEEGRLGAEQTVPVQGDGERELRRWKYRLFLFTGIVVFLLVAGNLFYVTTLFTRNSRFYCLTCHRLNQPAAMWRQSDVHSGGFACVPCHGVLPGGQARCGAFSAHPATVNPQCIGCHPRVRDGGPLDRVVEARRAPERPGEAGEVLARWSLRDLMYRWHVGNRVCVCTDCHRNVAHDPDGGSASPNRPKMVYCRECHYHRDKDAYVRISPLPELRASPAVGEGEQGR
jgi:hypothetical protein